MKSARIVSIGDSHSLYNFAGIKGAIFVTRAGTTMHRIARDGLESLLPKDFQVYSGDVLIVSCGDVDCRMHIKKHAAINKRTNVEEVDALCARLSMALEKFQGQFPGTVAISCIVPFNSKELAGKWSLKMTASEAHEIRSRMNTNLRNIGLPFIDFAHQFSNPDGSIKDGFSDGCVHIDPRMTRPIIAAVNDSLGLSVRYKRPPFPVDALLDSRWTRAKRKTKRYLSVPDRYIWRPARNTFKKVLEGYAS